MKETKLGEAPRLERLTRLVLRGRWIVLGTWAVIVLLSLVASSQLSSLLSNRFTVPGADAQRVEDLLERHFDQLTEGSLQVVVTTNATAEPNQQVVQLADVAARAGSKKLPNSGTRPAAPASPGVAIGTITSSLEQAEVKGYVADVRAAVRKELPPEYSAYVTGPGAFAADLDPVLADDLKHGELMFALPVALVVLALVFGSLGFLLPFIFALVTIPTTLGIVWIFAHAMDLSSYIMNLVVGVGLGVSIDYSLLLYWRFREERQRSAVELDLDPDSVPVRELAVMRTVITAGQAVVFSGIAVAIGLALLMLMPLPFMQGFGLAGLVIPLVSIVAALTLMPPLMFLTAHRLERVRLVSRRRMAIRDSIDDNGWARLAKVIMRRPIPFFAISAAILVTLAYPVTQIDLTPGSNTGLPTNLDSMRGAQALEDALGRGVVTPTVLLIDAGRPGAARSDEIQGALTKLLAAVSDDPEVLAVSPPTEDAYDQSERLIRISVANKHPYGSQRTRQFVERTRTSTVAKARFPEGPTVLVGGSPALGVDLIDRAYGAFPWLVAAVLALTYLLLLRAFRSLLLPLKAIILNLLSIGAAYGILEIVFDSRLGEKVGLTSYGPIEFWIPVFLFAVLFGLSMDYEVFLVSRMREFWDATHDNELAVSRGLASTGRLVTAAGIIMVTAFAGFMASRPVGFQQFGLGLSAAILIDITLVRAILLPSAMRLFGRWNWWLPVWAARVARVEPSPLVPVTKKPQ